MKTSVADGTAVGTDWVAQVLQITDDVTICGVCPSGFWTCFGHFLAALGSVLLL